MLLYLQGQDLAPLGYPGWLAFTREHVDWGEAWIRSVLRLVRSGLREVLRAVCAGRIPLTVAVTAPGTCHPAAQEAWVAAAVAGELPARVRRPSGVGATIEPGEADILAIWHARERVRLLEGLPLADREADERMLGWWRADRAEQVVATALAAAPRPSMASSDTEWGFADPADSLVGPWRSPSSLTDAMGLLSTIQAARRIRVVELGQIYERVVRERLHRGWGFRDVASFCQTVLGCTVRSLQRHQRLARALRRLPELGAAARAGMSLARVEAVARVATDDDVVRWITVAERTPAVELDRASRQVEAGADPDVLLDAYEAVMGTATGTVALGSTQTPVPPRLTDRVHPDLPQAARWLLAVELPPQRGFGRVKERDRFICANPECRRRALRNHAHHVRFRQHGGADTLDNGLCVCTSCHLRLIHAGHVQVEKVGAAVVWSFPGRVATVVDGPEM
ncbi:MAG: HNH endonuclease signature motif containing protein [Pseudomonadota bacterium]|nr:HNH endonuclease signature motif containing protein [Pseudomonadota bacterium]